MDPAVLPAVCTAAVQRPHVGAADHGAPMSASTAQLSDVARDGSQTLAVWES